MILNDRQLKAHEMVAAYPTQSTEISSGFSSFGYDATLGEELYLLTGGPEEVDPKDYNPKFAERVYPTKGDNGHYFVIPAGGFALGHTVEVFDIPETMLAICLGKSTYARCGLIVNVTPLEPEWRGQVTLELHNTTGRPIRVYQNEGICQFLFFSGSRPDVTYADRNGKYQDQRGVVFPKVKKKA